MDGSCSWSGRRRGRSRWSRRPAAVPFAARACVGRRSAPVRGRDGMAGWAWARPRRIGRDRHGLLLPRHHAATAAATSGCVRKAVGLANVHTRHHRRPQHNSAQFSRGSRTRTTSVRLAAGGTQRSACAVPVPRLSHGPTCPETPHGPTRQTETPGPPGEPKKIASAFQTPTPNERIRLHGSNRIKRSA